MSDAIFSGALATGFQPSSPILIEGEKITLDFKIAIIGSATRRVQWYFEFAEGNPYDASTLWFPETAEENVGNGDVRMPIAIRRFSSNSTDADLSPGTHYRSAQFQRRHKFARLQLAGTADCAVTVWSVFGGPPFTP
jgi:hypothetical protein